MNIEYSYGLLGYFAKYLGGVIMLALLGMLVFIAYLVPQHEVSWDSLFMSALVLFMAPICAKGSYYLFKFNDSFICRYAFTDSHLTITRKNKIIQNLPLDQISSVVYLKLPKVIEVHFQSIDQPIVLMNNAQYETQAFTQLRELLFKNNFVRTKWI